MQKETPQLWAAGAMCWQGLIPANADNSQYGELHYTHSHCVSIHAAAHWAKYSTDRLIFSSIEILHGLSIL
jgi:hypothetical protein